MKQKAKEYINRGWSVIPVKGKTPIVEWKEYQGRIVNEETIDLWFDNNPNANLGIVTGKISGITVIDVDGEKGKESLKKLKLPITLISNTPNGFHLVFKYNPSYPQGVGILPGIDIRNDGGYIVAPPSKGLSKLSNEVEEYYWGDESDLADLPDADLILGKKVTPKVEVKNPLWVEELLKKGQAEPGRNHAATRLAGHYRTKNLAIAETFEILKIFADRCVPKMNIDELWNTIESVYRYAGDVHSAKITEKPDFEKRGSQHVYEWQQYGLRVTLDQLFYNKDGLDCEIDIDFRYPSEPVFKYGPASLNLTKTRTISTLVSHLDKRFHFDWITVMDMVSRMAILHEREGEPFENLFSLKNNVPPAWLLRPLVIENETTIMFGDGGVGKSTLALAALLTIQSGKTLLGMPRKLLKGLYLDWEASSVSHARRLFSFIKGHNIPDTDIRYLRCIAPLHEMTNQLSKRIAEDNIQFIVVDSVAGACGGETEKAENAIKLFNAVGALKVSALLLAHVTKNSDVSQKPFGSTYWHNLARSTVEVKQKQEWGNNELHLILLHRKNNYGMLDNPIGFSVSHTEDQIVIKSEDPSTVTEFSKELKVSDQIYNVLLSGEKTVNEIVELTELKKQTVRKTLTRNERMFISDGGSTTNDEKLWGLVHKGFQAGQSGSTTLGSTSGSTEARQNEIFPEDVIK